MKVAILSFCLFFALQVQASFLFEIFLVFRTSTPQLTAFAVDVPLQVEESAVDNKSSQGGINDGSSTDIISDMQPEKFDVDSVLMEGPTPGQLVPRPGGLASKKFKTWLDQEKYDEIIDVANYLLDDDFLDQIYPNITTMKHYEGLLPHVRFMRVIFGFFALGSMVLVQRIVMESTTILDTDIEHDIIRAIALCIKKGFHDRVGDLMEVMQRRCAREDKGGPEWAGTRFWGFMGRAFLRLAPEKDSTYFKSFLINYADEFNNRHPDTYRVFCRKTVHVLKFRMCDRENAEKLLNEFIMQPIPLKPAVFIEIFLYHDYVNGTFKKRLIKYGWGDAILEGLKKEHEYGGELLWGTLKEQFPEEFIGGYPLNVESVQGIISKTFKSKEELWQEWAEREIPKFQSKLENLGLHFFPKALRSIIAEYAFSWVVTEDAVVPTD